MMLQSYDQYTYHEEEMVPIQIEYRELLSPMRLPLVYLKRKILFCCVRQIDYCQQKKIKNLSTSKFIFENR